MAMAADGVRAIRIDAVTAVFTLPNDIAAIEAGRRALFDFLDAGSLGGRVVNRIEVVFEEVVSNIVRHGFAAGSGQSIRVTATAGRDRIVLRFEDDGIAFDPLAAVPRPAAATLAETVLGGLGLPLVRKLAAATYHDRRDDAVEPDGFRVVNDLTVAIARE